MAFSRPTTPHAPASAVALLALFFGLMACDSPSGAGRGLIDEDGGVPAAASLLPTTIGTQAADDITGGTALNQVRVLAGQADDPLLGRVTATAFLDLSAPSRTSDFTGGTLTGAQLQLSRNYLYGDSTATLTFNLRSIPADWNPAGAALDTTFATGDVITTFTLGPTDTTKVIDLPAVWLAANDTTFRSARFSSSFHGFALEPVGATGRGAVRGVSTTASRLRAIAGGDTAFFPVDRVFSQLAREAPASPPAGRWVARDGVNEALAFTFTLPDTLRGKPLSNATLKFTVDTLALDQNDGFVRPQAGSVYLYGVAQDTLRILLSVQTVSASTGRVRLTSNTLRVAFQDALLGDPFYQRFELGFVPSPASLDALVLFDPSSDAAKAPRLDLVVVPSD